MLILSHPWRNGRKPGVLLVMSTSKSPVPVTGVAKGHRTDSESYVRWTDLPVLNSDGVWADYINLSACRCLLHLP